MYGKVKTIDIYTNKTIKVYTTAQIASRETGDSASYILNQCKRKAGTKVPTKNYYYRFVNDEPTTHTIIAVYNLDFELVAEYFNIQTAIDATGVGRDSIYKQLKNKLPIKERKSPTSGLFFVHKEVK